MSRNHLLGWSAALLLLAAAAVFLLEQREIAAGSTLSVGSEGWLVARRYLEERGRQSVLLDAPLTAGELGDVLVLSFPWQRSLQSDEMQAVHWHLGQGGVLLVAYSGLRFHEPEDVVIRWLGLEWHEARRRPPLQPIEWLDFVSEEWQLVPERGHEAESVSAVLSVPHRVPVPPSSAQILYRGPNSLPVVFTFGFMQGQVVLLPAQSFSNARLVHEGNQDLLESIGLALGSQWAFDEYHHGLSRSISAAGTLPRLAFDLLLFHVLLLYSLFILRLARRFGPVWQETPASSGGVASFLLGLGMLHQRLRHHQEAADLLVTRAAELHPRASFEEKRWKDNVTTGTELLELARRVAREQSFRRRKR